MRIIRGNSDNHDDNEHNHNHDRKQQPASESDATRMAETLVDEAEAFLAAQADAHPFEPEAEPKPVARLVKSLTGEQAPPVPVEDENLIPALRPQPDQPAAPRGRGVPRWVRTAVPGSVVVVALAVVSTHGQPGVVAVPIDIYASCWVGFLFWNAAHRPPLRDIAATTFSTAIGLLTGIGHRRGRLDIAPTAP
ncbi:hypothetical protein [Nocardia salmonicida]|uniref:hypothetical protein n=1 Tax=Nocardia salmonicida TaxID=53431 RepID=UPI002E2D74D0|nr:hypothetical protein [Nocardia salmonicida]